LTLGEQIRIAKETSQIRIAAEQAERFSQEVLPLNAEFYKHKREGKYPILSACVVKENWPHIESYTNNLQGLLLEIHSNNGLVIRILNKMEGIAMFFVCGVADSDKAYWPLSSTFCETAKAFVPYIVQAHSEKKQFTYTLMLYGSWGSRDHVERTEKEINDKKAGLSKVTVPRFPVIGVFPTTRQSKD